MLLLNGSMVRTRSGLTMSNYVIQSPDYPLSHHSQTQSIGMQIFLFFYQLKKKMKIHIEKIEKVWKGKKEKEEIIKNETNHLSSDEFHLPKRIIRRNSSIFIPAEN